MGDSAMSMMSGPHGDSGPAHCRKPPTTHAVTTASSLQLGQASLSPKPGLLTGSVWFRRIEKSELKGVRRLQRRCRWRKHHYKCNLCSVIFQADLLSFT